MFHNNSSYIYVRLDRVRGAKTKQTRNHIRNTQTPVNWMVTLLWNYIRSKCDALLNVRCYELCKHSCLLLTELMMLMLQHQTQKVCRSLNDRQMLRTLVRTNSVCNATCNHSIIMPPPLIGGRIKQCFFFWRLSVAYIRTKSRTERPRKTKIGTEVAHVTCDSDTTFMVKRSKVEVTRPLYSPL